MSRIEGPGEIQPQRGPQAKVTPKDVRHLLPLLSKGASLREVSQLIRQHSSGGEVPKTLYESRMSTLQREYKLLKKLQRLLQKKPKGYEKRVKEFLKEGESLKELEHSLPSEITKVCDRMRAVATAKLLTEPEN